MVRVSFCRGGGAQGGRSPHCGAPTAPHPPSQVFINYLKATSIPCFRYCALPRPPLLKQTLTKPVSQMSYTCHKSVSQVWLGLVFAGGGAGGGGVVAAAGRLGRPRRTLRLL